MNPADWLRKLFSRPIPPDALAPDVPSDRELVEAMKAGLICVREGCTTSLFSTELDCYVADAPHLSGVLPDGRRVQFSIHKRRILRETLSVRFPEPLEKASP